MWTLDDTLPEQAFPSELTTILQPDTNLWLWRRPLNPSLAAYLDEIASHLSLDLTLRLNTPARPASVLRNTLAAAGLRSDSHLDLWISDLAMLVRLFSRLRPNATVTLRLETVAMPDCRLFHVDNVELRLLCTYQGPGTQWLDNANVNRDQLNLQGRTVEAANRAIVIDPGRIATLQAGWVAVSKGEAYPDNRGRGWVHRAYPQAAGEPARLRLRLDHQRPVFELPKTLIKLPPD